MPPNCTLEQLAAVQAANSSVSYPISQIIWIWCCLLALGFNIATVFEMQRYSISLSIKTLFFCRIVFMTFFTISFVTSQFYSVFIQCKQFECDRLTPASTCVFFRFFQFWSISFFQLFHPAFLIITLLENTWSISSYIAWIVPLVSIIPVIPNILSEYNPEELMINCASFENMSKDSIAELLLFPIPWAIILFSILGYFFGWAVTHPDSVENRSPEEIEAAKKVFAILITFFKIFAIDLFTYLFSFICIEIIQISPMNAVDFMRFYPIPLNLFLTSLLLLVNLHRFGFSKETLCTPGETEKNTKESKESA